MWCVVFHKIFVRLLCPLCRWGRLYLLFSEPVGFHVWVMLPEALVLVLADPSCGTKSCRLRGGAWSLSNLCGFFAPCAASALFMFSQIDTFLELQ